MRSQARRLILVAALAAASAGCATAPSPVPRLAVHIDTIDPEKLAQFETARVRFVDQLRARGLTDRRGLFLKIGSHTYYSLTSFSRWCELDELRATRLATERKMGAAQAEYDRLCDETLTFPHASEIWTERPELSYLPTGRRLTDAVQVVIEDVKPTADYEAAWKPIAAALARAQYPLERRSYFAAYGSGRVLSFWLAPSATVAKTAPTLEQALAGVVGVAPAAELMTAWRACLVATQTLDVEPQPAMSRD